ncbi:hypothetical protein [Zoogloea sp.]|uniref:hypothetical protein n=1 Tax=Zoogloea sp. TaxID=49181 RepID=UPI0014165D5F|nr:MAG: hypothetical protein F9K15_10635 [Zoogloea sp.]HRH71636.1 hypothetical protein [Zoogloea sp.]
MLQLIREGKPVIGEILWRGKMDMAHGGGRAKNVNTYSTHKIVNQSVPPANELLHRPSIIKAVGCPLPINSAYSMGPISELSTTAMWRATTLTGETQVFHIKLIAIDWAGPGGIVEKAGDLRTGLSTESVGNSLDNALQPPP